MVEQINKSIGFIGAGNMAEALIKGMLDNSVVGPDKIHASDVRPARLDHVREQTGISISSRNTCVLENSDIVVLAVKPQQVKTVLAEISNETQDKVIVSIAAGISIDLIKEYLGGETTVVRAMPNTPAFVGEAMTSLAFSENVGGSDRAIIRSIFESVGRVAEIDEGMMNAVTAVSGSGPAYIFRLAEDMMKGARAAGLEPELSRELVTQTIIGAGKMLQLSGKSPEELRQDVTSPGGTTEAGLKIMDEKGFSEMIIKTIEAAAKRAEELSRSDSDL